MDRQKGVCLTEIKRNGMVYSVAAAGDMLYYTFCTTEGNLTVDGVTHGYGNAQLWALDLITGSEKKLIEIEGNECAFANGMILSEGEYKGSDTIVLRYIYSVRDEADKAQSFIISIPRISRQITTI